ncbi:MAG: hypothetical protein DMG72_17555 [Acidobacteria bacterium]|nr:MAG: hypothetical protein DMG72_17555 [Acidobacteriota bacterium]
MVRLWNLGPEDEITGKVFRYHKNQVWQVAFSPDGTSLASVGWDETMGLWDTKSSNGKPGFRSGIGWSDSME